MAVKVFTPKPLATVKWRKMPKGGVAAYAPPREGPFNCGHCEYLTDRGCPKPEVVKEFKLLGLIPGSATVAPVADEGCCAYQEQK